MCVYEHLKYFVLKQPFISPKKVKTNHTKVSFCLIQASGFNQKAANKLSTPYHMPFDDKSVGVLKLGLIHMPEHNVYIDFPKDELKVEVHNWVFVDKTVSVTLPCHDYDILHDAYSNSDRFTCFQHSSVVWEAYAAERNLSEIIKLLSAALMDGKPPRVITQEFAYTMDIGNGDWYTEAKSYVW